MMEKACIGFGSNQGDRIQNCLQAIDLLGKHPNISIEKISSLFRTEPVGFTDQDWFINGVVSCVTDLDPESLFAVTSRIENDMGRVRRQKWGPRTLDLDILLFGDRKLVTERLIIPHPRLHERRFVLVPLAEVAPDWIHPVFGVTVQALLARLSEQGQQVELWRER